MTDSLPSEPPAAEPYGYLTWFQECLYDESGRARDLYGPEQGGALEKYYADDRNRYLDRRQHEVNRYTRTRENFILRRIIARQAPRVLDCGCGLGSEAVLFASLGARVTGIDLKPERLVVAELRRDRYSKLLGKELAIDFRLDNIFDLDFEGEFDIIWVKEAISHIHPLPDFYAFARRALKTGGELVITDPNAENAPKRRWVEARRHGPVITTFPHPRTGEPIPYADERILTIPELLAELREGGFRIGEVECYLPGQSATPFWFWNAVLRPLNHWIPLTRKLGDEYCLSAVKPQ